MKISDGYDVQILIGDTRSERTFFLWCKDDWCRPLSGGWFDYVLLQHYVYFVCIELCGAWFGSVRFTVHRLEIFRG